MSFETMIDDCIEKVDKLILDLKDKKINPTEFNADSLKLISSELKQMKINKNPRKFVPTYGHLLKDSWTWDTQEEKILRDKLSELEYYYMKIKK